MSQKAEKPPDPAHEAKLAARREKHAVKVWSANPRTQELQRKYDEALRQLQQLRDGTFCRQYTAAGHAPPSWVSPDFSGQIQEKPEGQSTCVNPSGVDSGVGRAWASSLAATSPSCLSSRADGFYCVMRRWWID